MCFEIIKFNGHLRNIASYVYAIIKGLKNLHILELGSFLNCVQLYVGSCLYNLVDWIYIHQVYVYLKEIGWVYEEGFN